MGGLCVLLLMMFCVGWILCVFFLSMLIPLLILYNGIVGIVCFILYFVLRKKSVFTKYTEGYKHVLSSILKYGLIVYGSISLVFSIIFSYFKFLLGENMTILGVDLGTTNSLAVVYKEGKPVLIPNAYGEYVTPSAVSILDGKIVVGKLAKERLITHPECSASLFKRNMGTDVTYTLDKKEYDSATLSSFILKQLIEDAQNYLHESIDEVVISVPAYFNAASKTRYKANRRTFRN